MARRLEEWTLLTISLLVGLIQITYAQPSSTEKPTLSTPSAQTVYKKVSNSIFTLFGVEIAGEEGSALGSAVAVGEHLLATNCHVAFAGNILVVRINNQTKLGSVIYHYDNDDLCIVQVDDAKFTSVKIRPSSEVQIGEDVVAIGNPKGYEKSISKGIISNIYNKNNLPLDLENFYIPLKHICEKDGFSVLQTDAPISHGSSGGGLFDYDGNLIGITTSGDDRGENLGFAIPTELILEVIEPKNKISTTHQHELTHASPPTEQTKSATIGSRPVTNSTDLIGYYGKSKLGVFHWNNNKCLITITGRYRPNEATSLAIWYPDNPDELFIFPKITAISDAVNLLNKIYQSETPQYVVSKSFLLLDNKLYALTILAKNNVNYPVYIFSINKNLTENFVVADYFLAQIYHFKGQSGLTTIKFDLDGFTQAFAAYTKNCHQE